MASSDATLANAETQADVEPRQLLAQGAESRVFEGQLGGRPAVVKQRFSKKYRHPTLDRKLTTARLKQEVRCMVRARKLGVLTAVLYAVDLQEASISMERVDGSTVKALLHSSTLQGPELQAVLTQIGEALAVLHDGSLVHGDLTTSNLMVRSRDAALVRAAQCSGSVPVACKTCQRASTTDLQESIHQTLVMMPHHDAVRRSCWISDSAPRHHCPRTRVWTCTCWSAPSRALTRQSAIACLRWCLQRTKRSQDYGTPRSISLQKYACEGESAQ